MRPIILLFCCVFYFLVACSSEKQNLTYTDLLTYGIPIEIQAPDSVDITSSDMGSQKDVVLQGADGYRIQIFSSDAYKNEASTVAEYKREIKQNPLFKEFVREEPNGFVYAFQLDSTTINHGFRFIQVRNGKEIVIQQGMLGLYSKEEADRLFTYALNSK